MRFGCRLSRSILADKPRVTRFPVEFDPVEAAPGAAQAHAQVPGQQDTMTENAPGAFMKSENMQMNVADDAGLQKPEQGMQSSMGFGAPQPAAVDMEA